MSARTKPNDRTTERPNDPPDEATVPLSAVRALVEAEVTKALAAARADPRPVAPPVAPEPEPEPLAAPVRFRLLNPADRKPMSRNRVQLPRLSVRYEYPELPALEDRHLRRLGHDNEEYYVWFLAGECITDKPREVAELRRLIAAKKLNAVETTAPQGMECHEHRFWTVDPDDWRAHLATMHDIHDVADLLVPLEGKEHRPVAPDDLRGRDLRNPVAR
jgi:hypothetical protein